MAIDIRATQVIKEDDGVYTATIEFFDDATGAVLQRFTAQGTTRAEFKDLIQAKYVKLQAAETLKAQATAILQQAIADVKSEV